MKKLKLIIILAVSLFVVPTFTWGINDESKRSSVIYAEEIEKEIQDKNYNEFNSMVNDFIGKRNQELKMIEHLKRTEEYIILFNSVMDKYSWLLDCPETIYDYFTPSEIEMIARVVETETFGGTFLAKCNVSSVIFNRYNDETGIFPDTISEILHQENQFASNKTNISASTIHAMEYAFSIEDTTGGALWFNTENCNSWAERNRQLIFTDEVGHKFYK